MCLWNGAAMRHRVSLGWGDHEALHTRQDRAAGGTAAFHRRLLGRVAPVPVDGFVGRPMAAGGAGTMRGFSRPGVMQCERVCKRP